MKNSIIIKRYAEAFIAYAKETSGLERALEDFKNISQVLKDTPEFLQFLQAPEITEGQKKDFIDKVLGDDFSREFGQFLKLLLEKSRIELSPGIIKYVIDIYSHGDEAEALFKTAFPVDSKLVDKIKKGLELKLNKKLKFVVGIDPSLLGGVQVTIGNTVIDGSLRRRLDELKETLETVRV